MESQPQTPELRNNPENFHHGILQSNRLRIIRSNSIMNYSAAQGKSLMNTLERNFPQQQST